MTISYAVSSSFLGIFRSKIEVLPHDHFFFFFFLSILCKYWYNVNISKYTSFKIVVTYWERLAWMMDEWMDGWFSTPLCLYARSLQRYCRLLDEVPKATEFRGWVDALFVHYVVFYYRSFCSIFCLKFYHSILKMPPNVCFVRFSFLEVVEYFACDSFYMIYVCILWHISVLCMKNKI